MSAIRWLLAWLTGREQVRMVDGATLALALSGLVPPAEDVPASDLVAYCWTDGYNAGRLALLETLAEARVLV